VYSRIEKDKKKDKEHYEALIILKIELAAWRLRTQDFAGCKKILEEAKEQIDKEGYVDNAVNSAYYRVKSDYLLRSEEFNDFYRHALMYLAYTPIESIPFIQQQAIAYDIGIAALVGDKVYNFGELLMHPVVESLQNSQAEWLLKLLYAFNKGDIAQYRQLMQQYHGQIESRKIFQNKRQFLEDKIQLMSLMDLVFSKAAGNRVIPFTEVSTVTGKPLDQVEHLLLKALAFNLIKGVIDQVAQTIQVSWVQPRVLEKSQIAQVTDKIGAWLNKVDATISFLEKEGASSL
jgi:26S proteasome regulatory subunit N9